MPTSSITEDIVVHNPRFLVEYMKHLEESAKYIHPRTEAEKSGVCDDPVRIKKLMDMVRERHKND